MCCTAHCITLPHSVAVSVFSVESIGAQDKKKALAQQPNLQVKAKFKSDIFENSFYLTMLTALCWQTHPA